MTYRGQKKRGRAQKSGDTSESSCDFVQSSAFLHGLQQGVCVDVNHAADRRNTTKVARIPDVSRTKPIPCRHQTRDGSQEIQREYYELHYHENFSTSRKT